MASNALSIRAQTERNVNWAEDSLAKANLYLDKIKIPTPPNTSLSLGQVALSVDNIADAFVGTRAATALPVSPAPFISGAIYNPAVPVLPNKVAALANPVLPVAPSTALPAAPVLPAAAVNFTVPTAPAITLPPLPTLQQVNVPVAPTNPIAPFTGTLPALALAPPAISFSYTEVPYSSALLTQLTTFLAGKLNGGTGLTAAVEAQLWDRARSREATTSAGAIQAATEGLAALGFDSPPGALLRQVQNAQNIANEKLSSVSRDIAIKQADLEQENDKAYSAAAMQLESLLVQHSDNVANRELEVSKSRVELGIAVFNAQVSVFNAELSRYSAEAEVFKALVSSALTKAQMYRTEVEAAKVGSDIQASYVDLYRAQLQGIEASVGIYRVQMDAVKAQTDIERSKVEIGRSQVGAYSAQVQAKVAEYSLYTAQIDGEKTKAEVHSEQVRAYSTEVEAYKASVASEESRVRASVQTEQSRLEGYKAQINGFAAELAAAETTIKAELGGYEADIKAFDTGVRAKVANAEVQLKLADIEVQRNLHFVDIIVSRVDAEARQFSDQAKMVVQAQEFGASVYADMAKAAMAGITTIIQDNAQETVVTQN